MTTREITATQKFRTLCEELTNNDPSITSLDISAYGKLDWDSIEQLAAALEQNTHVREMTLRLGREYITSDGCTPLVHYLGTSKSLRKVCVDARGETPEQDLGATSVLEAVSRNKNVVSLRLEGAVYRRPSMIQTILTRTPTLTHFEFCWKEDSGRSSEVSQALRQGLRRNTSLKTANLKLGRGPTVPDVLLGLVSLRSLRNLDLSFTVTVAASEALRFFLAGNETLEQLCLTLSYTVANVSPARAAPPSLKALLVGLAFNRGLKTFRLRGGFLAAGPAMRGCTNAWVEMLEDNSTLEEIDVGFCIGIEAGTVGPDCASGIARGLSKNDSLKKVRFGGLFKLGAFDGATWGDALEKNNTLRELVLTSCKLGTGSDFDSFAQGLVCNRSLKLLDLSGNCITQDAQVRALNHAFQANDVLESLDLTGCTIGRTDNPAGFVRGLWSKKNLLHLNLFHNHFEGWDDSTPFFSEGLPKNGTLQTLNIGDCDINSSDFCVVVNSLCGSRALQTLTAGNNRNLSIEGPAAAALKELLLSSSLAKLYLEETELSREGTMAIATGLHENTRLRELDLSHCEVDGEELLALGKALQVNSTLESLNVSHASGYDNEVQCRFFGLLPRMKGLKTLSTACWGGLEESLVEAIIEGLRRNTSLEHLHTGSDDDLPADSLKSIEFYLKMNRNGRKYLQEDDKAKDKTKNGEDSNSNNVRAAMPHIGAWPRVLAKMTSPSEQDQLFYFLRRKNDLFQNQGPQRCTQSRKRKASDSATLEE